MNTEILYPEHSCDDLFQHEAHNYSPDWDRPAPDFFRCPGTTADLEPDEVMTGYIVKDQPYSITPDIYAYNHYGYWLMVDDRPVAKVIFPYTTTYDDFREHMDAANITDNWFVTTLARPITVED